MSYLGSRERDDPCSENKGADQLRGHRETDLRLCFRICKRPVSHNEAQQSLYWFQKCNSSIQNRTVMNINMSRSCSFE